MATKASPAPSKLKNHRFNFSGPIINAEPLIPKIRLLGKHPLRPTETSSRGDDDLEHDCGIVRRVGLTKKNIRYHTRFPFAFRLRFPTDIFMSETKIRGIVHVVEETKTYGQKGFRKRLVVLEQDTGRFTNYIPIEFLRDNCELADDLNVGDDIEISYQLSGRKWQKDSDSETKYFLTAEAISFKVMGSGGDSSQVDPAEANDAFAESNYDENDIPF